MTREEFNNAITKDRNARFLRYEVSLLQPMFDFGKGAESYIKTFGEKEVFLQITNEQLGEIIAEKVKEYERIESEIFDSPTLLTNEQE
jgi:hypothetical protein